MIELKRIFCKIKLDKNQWNIVINEMNLTGFLSLAWQTKVNLLKLAGVQEIGKDLYGWMGDPFNTDKLILRADVFIKGNDIFYLIESPHSWSDNTIEAGIITKDASKADDAIIPFITCFINAIKVRIDGRISRHMNLSWYRYNVNDYVSGRVFDKRCKYAQLNSEEVAAASVLYIQANRSLLRKISKGEIKTEPDQRAIDELLGKSLIQKTNSKRKYILTSLGKNMLSGSQWMTVWLTEKLVSMGVPVKAVVWSLREDSEEVDCAVEIRNKVWIFELKDRNFEPGDAHPLFYRAAKFKATKTIIIATGIITANARRVFDEYFDNQKDYPICIEGLNDLDDTLRKLVSNAHLESVVDKSKTLSDRMQINLQPIFTKLLGRYFQEYKGKFK